MLAGVFEPVARLIRELAEVDLPRMRRHAEHEDVGARTEDAVLQAGHDDRAHFGVLEADAIDRVVQFDVDAEVVAVELQLVAGTDAGILVDVQAQRGDRPVELHRPVAVARRLDAVVDGLEGRIGGGLPGLRDETVRHVGVGVGDGSDDGSFHASLLVAFS
jgi:hypothetical protein